MEKPILTSEYRSTAELDAWSLARFERASKATGAIKVGQRIIANALLISPTLALVIGHSFDERRNDIYIQFPWLRDDLYGRVLFDGLVDSRYKTDFKIIQIHPVTDRDPAQLSVSASGLGRVMQFFYGVTGRQYVNVYEQDPENHTTNADRIKPSGWVGERGGPRLSMRSGCVQSMHQGERAGFTINQMMMTLEQAHTLNKQLASAIIRQLDIPDFATRYTNNPSISRD